MKKLSYLRVLSVLLITLLSLGGSGAQGQSGAPSLFLPFIPNTFTPGPGVLTGFVINASSPDRDAIPGAQVCAQSTCAVTGEAGEYRLEGIESGVQIITVSAEEYNTVKYSVRVIALQEVNKNFAISQRFSGDQISLRIVLTWDETPAWPPESWDNDLNAHLWLSVPNPPTHISYLELGNCKTFPNACMEQEFRNGFGPETIAIRLFENATYYYGVLNENQGRPGVPPITQTQAFVQIYGETGTMYTYDVPLNGDGDFWYLFSIEALDGQWQLATVNCITDLPPEGELPTCEPAPERPEMRLARQH